MHKLLIKAVFHLTSINVNYFMCFTEDGMAKCIKPFQPYPAKLHLNRKKNRLKQLLQTSPMHAMEQMENDAFIAI